MTGKTACRFAVGVSLGLLKEDVGFLGLAMGLGHSNRCEDQGYE
jgi:hypothetical protein